MASPTTERILRGHAPKGIYRAERLRRRGSKCHLSAPQPLREIFSSPRGKWLTPPEPTDFPSPTSTTLCHRARGCAGLRTTPGSGRSAFPTPQGVVPFVPAGGCDIKGRNGMGIPGADEQSSRKDMQRYTQYPMPPVRSFGTTLSGLLICWALTQGSASAAQPWALWQNPFRIPGGGSPAHIHTPGIAERGRRLGHRVTTG